VANLEGIQFFGQRNLENTVVNSVIDFLRYGFLELGAYYNVASGNLRPVSTPLSTGSTFTEFAGIKHDWVFSTGFTTKATGVTLPLIPSGILFNGTFVPTGTAVSGSTWHFDYSRGRVVFSSGMPSGTSVATSYAVNYVSVYPRRSSEYTRLISDWVNATGTLTLSLEQKAFLPCIFVGIEGYDTKRGVGLGTRGKVSDIRFTFDIFATDDFTRSNLQDICYFLETKNIPLLNYNVIQRPLNVSGVPVGTGNWNLWKTTSVLGQGRFNENFSVRVYDKFDLPYKASRVTITMESDLYPS
jgi:hypothetical protein